MAGQRLNIPLQGQCSRKKIRFYSKAIAESQLYQLKSVGLGRPEDGHFHVYFCDLCRAWHTGHTLKPFNNLPTIHDGLTTRLRRRLDP